MDVRRWQACLSAVSQMLSRKGSWIGERRRCAAATRAVQTSSCSWRGALMSVRNQLANKLHNPHNWARWTAARADLNPCSTLLLPRMRAGSAVVAWVPELLCRYCLRYPDWVAHHRWMPSGLQSSCLGLRGIPSSVLGQEVPESRPLLRQVGQHRSQLSYRWLTQAMIFDDRSEWIEIYAGGA